MNRRILSFLLLMTACFYASAGTIDINGTSYRSDTLEHYQVGPGTMYTRFNVTIGSTVHKMYMFTADLTDPYIKVEEYQAKDHMGDTETLVSAHQKIDSVGHRPIGSVNCNFWCVSGNISGPESSYAGLMGQPFAGTAKDGVLIGNPSTWNDGHGDRGYFMIDDLGRALIRNMKWSGRVCKNGSSGYAIRDVNRQRNNPNASEIALFNRYIGTTRPIADTVIEVIFEPIDGQEWVINDTMLCRVISRNHTGGTTLTGKQGALQGRGTRGNWVDRQLQVGDTFQIKLGIYSSPQMPDVDTSSADSIAPRIMQMVTGNCLVMANGELTHRNYNETYNNQNYPRTLLATNNEGNRVWFLVSEAPGNFTHEMCCMVRNDGATWAAGMDGGGSAQINVLGDYPFISRDGSPRPVANQIFLVSTAPDDNAVSRIEFVDNLPSTVSSYASYTPAMRAYNQYGWLLHSDFSDYTLSCEPASLGSISPDGRTFIAGTEAGSGTLTASFGSLSVTKQITIEAGTVSLGMDSLWIDNRSYFVPAFSTTASGRKLSVNPAFFNWTITDNSICDVSNEGALSGLSCGETDIVAELGGSSAPLHVTVQIPESESLVSTRFLGADTAVWTLKNGTNAITWGTEISGTDTVSTLNFELSSTRNPQVSLTGNWPLYAMPDSIELLVESPVNIKQLNIMGAAHNAPNTQLKLLLDEGKAGELTRYCWPLSQFSVDPEDLTIYPFCLQKLTFTLTEVKTKTPYVLKLRGLILHYSHHAVISSVEDMPLAPAPEKRIIDGHLYILRDGRIYDASGRLIR